MVGGPGLAKAHEAARQSWPLILVVILALVLRVVGAVPHTFNHADEIWQYLEPARGLTGRAWLTTWEYREGIRSWLLPILMAGPLAAGLAVTGDNLTAVVIIRMIMAVLSLSIVISGMVIAGRISRLHALVVGIVLATSTDIIFFSARTLSETVGTILLLPAAALLLRPVPRQTPVTWFASGMLLGLAFCIRFQFGPMLGVLAVLALRTNWRGWAWCIAGGLGALAIDAIANLSQGAVPFRWLVENLRINIVEHRSARYGVEPWWWYPRHQYEGWGLAMVPVAILALVGLRRSPVLAIVAVVNIALLSLVPHKEYRFILPSVVLLILVAGIGTADIIAAARRRNWEMQTTAIMVAAWLALAAAPMMTTTGRLRAGGQDGIALMRSANGKQDLCGLATLRQITLTSYTYLDRAVPIYLFSEDGAERTLANLAGSFNAVVAERAAQPMLARSGYSMRKCVRPPHGLERFGVPERCVFERPGACVGGDSRYLENAVRARIDI